MPFPGLLSGLIRGLSQFGLNTCHVPAVVDLIGGFGVKVSLGGSHTHRHTHTPSNNS
jgi:hypothetical protein